MVTDTSCKGNNFRTCKGPIIESWIGSCAWSKGEYKKTGNGHL